jgi:hypothetical protein
VYSNRRGVGQAWVVAVENRCARVLAGASPTPPFLLSVCPNLLTMSAATPTACGAAIEVPCRYW